MPHLSPLKWKMMALITLLLMTMSAASVWWFQLPLFLTQKPSCRIKYPFKTWQWG